MNVARGLIRNVAIRKQLANKRGHDPNIALYYRRGGEIVSTDQFTFDATFPWPEIGAIESFLACRINNKICVIGCDNVEISVAPSVPIQTTLIADLFYRDYDRLTALGRVSEIVERVYGAFLRFAVTVDSPVRDPLRRQNRVDAVAGSPAALSYRNGCYVALNIGHRLSSVGLVRLTNVGLKLSDFNRFATDRFRNYADANNFVRRAFAQASDRFNKGGGYVGAIISIAETVVAGNIHANLSGGLFGSMSAIDAASLTPQLSQTARELCSVADVLVINDSCAEGIYASRTMGSYRSGEVHDYLTNLLTIRFGTWSAISYVSSTGYNIDRINEYSYLSTHTFVGPPRDSSTAIGDVFSFRGFGILARECGLLEQYRIPEADAPAALYEMFSAGDEREQEAAARVYISIGERIALLVDEIQCDVRIQHICLLGSIANHIVHRVAHLMEKGFRECARFEGMDVAGIKFQFIPDASHDASIIGGSLQLSETVGVSL